MPRVNLSGVPAADDFPVVDEGQYKVTVKTCVEEPSKNGDPMWTIDLRVDLGPLHEPDAVNVGRNIRDRITWSEKGLKRVKLVLSRLGLDVDSDADVSWEPEHIIGRSAIVDVTISEYQGKARNDIPFAGYHHIEDAAVAQAQAQPPSGSLNADDDTLPF